MHTVMAKGTTVGTKKFYKKSVQHFVNVCGSACSLNTICECVSVYKWRGSGPPSGNSEIKDSVKERERLYLSQ